MVELQTTKYIFQKKAPKKYYQPLKNRILKDWYLFWLSVIGCWLQVV